MAESEEPIKPESGNPTGEAIPTPPTVTEAGDTGKEPLKEEPQPTPPPSEPEAHPLWRFLVYLLEVSGAVFATGSTVIFLLGLWDSYRPKITITPGGTLNGKTPFATYFNVQNAGSLSISHVIYRTYLTIVPPSGSTNQVVFQEQNVTAIPQMKPLESYSLSIKYTQVQFAPLTAPIETNQVISATNQVPTTKQIQVAQIILAFDVTYHTAFFGQRTSTLYFACTQDIDGNWQWLPTGHQSVNDQIIDTDLVASLQPKPAPVVIPTNGSAQVHTNQTKPN